MIKQKNTHSQFTFKPVDQADLTLLHSWFQKPHVSKWWPVPKEQEDFFNTFLPRIRLNSTTRPYLVLRNNMPIGYIQTYSVDIAKSTWLPKLTGKVIGTDQFIGEEDYLGKGFGTLFIKEFIRYLFAKEGGDITIIVDPDPTNIAAIKCYEKVGFKKLSFIKLGIYEAPWGPALVMSYKA